MPSMKDFAASLNSEFRVARSSGDAMSMRLVKLDESGSNDVQETFSLQFLANGNAEPKQGLYSLTHDLLGELDIFLVPVARDENGLYFEAVFNRFIEPA